MTLPNLPTYLFTLQLPWQATGPSTEEQQNSTSNQAGGSGGDKYFLHAYYASMPGIFPFSVPFTLN